jgi:hypothetical protein
MIGARQVEISAAGDVLGGRGVRGASDGAAAGPLLAVA